MGFLKKLKKLKLGKIAKLGARLAVAGLPGGTTLGQFAVSKLESMGVNRKRAALVASKRLSAIPTSERAALKGTARIAAVGPRVAARGPAKKLTFAELGPGGALESREAKQKRAARGRINQVTKENRIFSEWLKQGKPGKWDDFLLANS